MIAVLGCRKDAPPQDVLVRLEIYMRMCRLYDTVNKIKYKSRSKWQRSISEKDGVYRYALTIFQDERKQRMQRKLKRWRKIMNRKIGKNAIKMRSCWGGKCVSEISCFLFLEWGLCVR